MAATEFQRAICRLIAKSRRDSGESYIAGGVALNTLLRAPRVSRDIDLFHDTDEALRASWDNDPSLLVRGRYTQAELDELAFEGSAPNAAMLGARWHRVLVEARSLVECLPAEHVGEAVLDAQGQLYRGDPERLRTDLQAGAVNFHAGRIRGVWPTFPTKPGLSDALS